jgi:hypothetical protein
MYVLFNVRFLKSQKYVFQKIRNTGVHVLHGLFAFTYSYILLMLMNKGKIENSHSSVQAPLLFVPSFLLCFSRKPCSWMRPTPVSCGGPKRPSSTAPPRRSRQWPLQMADMSSLSHPVKELDRVISMWNTVAWVHIYALVHCKQLQNWTCEPQWISWKISNKRKHHQPFTSV